jgi:hypothetical protein
VAEARDGGKALKALSEDYLVRQPRVNRERKREKEREREREREREKERDAGG